MCHLYTSSFRLQLFMVIVFDIDFPIETYDIPNHPAIRSLSGTSGFLHSSGFSVVIPLKQTQIDKILPKTVILNRDSVRKMHTCLVKLQNLGNTRR